MLLLKCNHLGRILPWQASQRNLTFRNPDLTQCGLRTFVSEVMRVDNMRVDSLVRILNACGYKLIIRSEQKGIADREVEV